MNKTAENKAAENLDSGGQASRTDQPSGLAAPQDPRFAVIKLADLSPAPSAGEAERAAVLLAGLVLAGARPSFNPDSLFDPAEDEVEGCEKLIVPAWNLGNVQEALQKRPDLKKPLLELKKSAPLAMQFAIEAWCERQAIQNIKPRW